MKNKIIKIILVFAIALTIFSNYNIQAITDPIANPDAYAPPAPGEEKALKDMAGQILGIINTVGVVVAVIVLMIIGIRYMLGSAEEKAEYKKTMTGYIIGAILLFSVTTIPNLLYKIGTSI